MARLNFLATPGRYSYTVTQTAMNQDADQVRFRPLDKLTDAE